tara:strand:+ start:9367 stop:11790 length:2424 start_codon:yes stop_codon:yes gene_type:complete
LLDESEWNNKKLTKSIRDLVQAEPEYGASPSKKTEIKILYSQESLYIGVYLFDDLDNIKTKNALYDDWYEGFDNNADYFVIELDSDHDHQQSYCFAVNSSGVKADYIMYNDGNFDEYWNSVYWNAKVSLVDDGWIIEYEIPFKILDYFKNDTMGINFLRFSHSDKEYHRWVLLPMEINGIVSHYGHIKNLELPNNRNFDINSYIVSGNSKFENQYYQLREVNGGYIIDTTNISSEIDSPNIDKLGFDINYSPNSFLNFSYTHNSDFGQIEQINSYINFSSYENFYEERRPFFVNNSRIYSTPIDIFYSQRIGSNVVYENQLYNVFIKDAFRIDGLGDKNFNYGILYVQSEIDKNFNMLFDKKIKTIISRVRKKIINDNSYFGFTNSFYEDFKDLSKAYSIDGLFSLFDDRLKIDGQIALSNIDSTSNGLGQSYEISYRDLINRKNSRFFHNSIFDLWVNYQKYDKDFYINHVGYLERNNFSVFDFGISNTKNNPNKLSISRMFHFRYTSENNLENDNLGKVFLFEWQNIFSNNYYFEFQLIGISLHYDDWLFLDLYNYDYFSNSEIRPIVKIPGSNHIKFIFSTDQTNQIFIIYNSSYFKDDLEDVGFAYTVDLNYKPTKWLSVNLIYDLENKTDKYNFLKRRRSFVPDLGNAHRSEDNYLFSDSDIFEKQITVSISSSFLKNFNINLFGNYFIYDNYFSPSEPYSKLSVDNSYMYPDLESEPTNTYFSDRLLYSANYSSLEFNCILKWEFDRRFNLYFTYSKAKMINGRTFNKLRDFIDYQFENDGTSELFYDQSLGLKFDFLLDI